MLREKMFNGVYRDEQLKVETTLLNPLEYGFNEAVMLFTVKISARQGYFRPSQNDFKFYLLGKSNNLSNAILTISNPPEEPVGQYCRDDKSFRMFTVFEFKPEYLYLDLQFAFYYKQYKHIIIIRLED